ncbi:MAG: indole-3-glycerol phosphate synthase TrpC [Pseudomonadota bacterium]
MSTPTILEKIKAYKLEEIAAAKAARPLSELEAEIATRAPTRGFASALDAAIRSSSYGLIAEIKKASPSKGLIREDFDVPALAQAYAAGGAACLSVLTDGPSFQGSEVFLRQARESVDLPILRKDFLYDTYQVAEARAMGADCILIIMASVSDLQAQELEAAATAYGLEVLVEVHNDAELTRAGRLSAPLLGINNRDLNTFEVTLETTRKLAKFVPGDRMIISESGLFEPGDLAGLVPYGVRSFLIGESLMRQDDVTTATRHILSEKPPMGGM